MKRVSARLSSFSLTCSLCSYDVRHEPGTAADEAAMLHDGFSQQPPTRQKLELFAGSAGLNKDAINADLHITPVDHSGARAERKSGSCPQTQPFLSRSTI